ncbi:hypothetical protein ACQPW3_31745 [Actinosynnema sp. CA-248983]
MITNVSAFLCDLTGTNSEIARYLLACIDSGGRLPDERFPETREQDLGARMVELGQLLQERARGRHAVVIDTSSPEESDPRSVEPKPARHRLREQPESEWLGGPVSRWPAGPSDDLGETGR